MSLVMEFVNLKDSNLGLVCIIVNITPSKYELTLNEYDSNFNDST